MLPLRKDLRNYLLNKRGLMFKIAWHIYQLLTEFWKYCSEAVFCYKSTFQMVGSHICDGEFIFNEEKLNIITSIIASTFSWRIPTKTGLYQSDWARNRSYTLNNLSQLGGSFKAKLSVRLKKIIIKQIYGVLLFLEPVWYLTK